MKKILLYFLAIFISFLAYLNIAYAAALNYTVSVSNSKVKPGDIVDVYVSVSGASSVGKANFKIDYDSSKFKYEKTITPAGKSSFVSNADAGSITTTYSDATGGANPLYNGTAVTYRFSAINLTQDASGTFNVSLSGAYDISNNEYSVNPLNTSVSCLVHIPNENSYLGSLSVSGGTLTPSFDKNNTHYSLETDANSITINATPEAETSYVTGAGTKELKYGLNNFTLVVTSESGATKAYFIEVNRPDNRNGDNTLSDLKVSNTDIKFDGKIVYTYTVGYDVTSVNIDATPNNSKSVVSGTGTKYLSVGKNNFVIKVTSENEKTKQYVVTIIRENANSTTDVVLSNDNYLSNIIVEGATFTFDRNVNDYEFAVPYSQDRLVLNYVLEDNSAIANVVGDETLKVGNNSVVILVTAENGEIRTYNLTIIRNEDKVVVPNDKTSIDENINNESIGDITISLKDREKAVTLDAETIGYLKNFNKNIIFEWLNENGIMLRSIKILGVNIVDTSNSINPNLNNSITDSDLLKYLGNREFIGISSKNSSVPSGTIYRLKLEDNDKPYYLYYFKDGKVQTKKLNIDDGYAEFEIENDTDYAIAGEVINNDSNEEEIGNRYLPIIIIIILAIISTICAIILLRENKKNKIRLMRD